MTETALPIGNVSDWLDKIVYIVTTIAAVVFAVQSMISKFKTMQITRAMIQGVEAGGDEATKTKITEAAKAIGVAPELHALVKTETEPEKEGDKK